VLAAPIGVWVAHVAPVALLRRLFAAFLVFAAGSLAYKTFSASALIGDANHLAAAFVRLVDPGAASPVAAEMPAWMRGRADTAAHARTGQRGDSR
jgi:hypothetical protein